MLIQKVALAVIRYGVMVGAAHYTNWLIRIKIFLLTVKTDYRGCHVPAKDKDRVYVEACPTLLKE